MVNVTQTKIVNDYIKLRFSGVHSDVAFRLKECSYPPSKTVEVFFNTGYSQNTWKLYESVQMFCDWLQKGIS